MSAAELALHVGLHVTTVRFHLEQLVAVGLVDSAFQRRGGAGRPRKVYSVAPGSLVDVDPAGELDSLRLLSGLLARALADGSTGPAPSPADVGRQWAKDHVPADPDETPADPPPLRAPLPKARARARVARAGALAEPRAGAARPATARSCACSPTGPTAAK